MKSKEIYYPRHSIFLLDSDWAGREVGNTIEIIKSKEGRFWSLPKEEFLKFKTNNHITIKENDILYIVPKFVALWFTVFKLQGKL